MHTTAPQIETINHSISAQIATVKQLYIQTGSCNRAMITAANLQEDWLIKKKERKESGYFNDSAKLQTLSWPKCCDRTSTEMCVNKCLQPQWTAATLERGEGQNLSPVTWGTDKVIQRTITSSYCCILQTTESSSMLSVSHGYILMHLLCDHQHFSLLLLFNYIFSLSEEISLQGCFSWKANSGAEQRLHRPNKKYTKSSVMSHNYQDWESW